MFFAGYLSMIGLYIMAIPSDTTQIYANLMFDYVWSSYWPKKEHTLECHGISIISEAQPRHMGPMSRSRIPGVAVNWGFHPFGATCWLLVLDSRVFPVGQTTADTWLTRWGSLSYRIHGAGIYTNIGGILMVNVTIYSIHGSHGSWNVRLSAFVGHMIFTYFHICYVQIFSPKVGNEHWVQPAVRLPWIGFVTFQTWEWVTV